ncbi:Fur family transcriptional regulator [Actinoallomurus soli]|uniref:Fur family transcriptional regulator n=1 Tax=Actinoallomurus soli TaxID=2952535 RepID=UPI002093CD65|nr:transcriptional repressor [Actinoallomurus soli]MCO5968287.1 transcriptional repressor [Actinoallomurus soli]
MRSHPATAGRSGGGGVDEPSARLRAAGLSPTRRRRQVLEALDGRRRPIGAHELYVELAGQGHRVGMSTVYRTLAALADAGLLHVFIRDGETRYRPCAPGRHYHLVCRRCGDVQEHPAADDGAWLDAIAAEADFEPDPRQAEVYGVCGSCLRTGPDGLGG